MQREAHRLGVGRLVKADHASAVGRQVRSHALHAVGHKATRAGVLGRPDFLEVAEEFAAVRREPARMPIHAMDAEAIGATSEHVGIAQCLVPMAFDKDVTHGIRLRPLGPAFTYPEPQENPGRSRADRPGKRNHDRKT